MFIKIPNTIKSHIKISKVHIYTEQRTKNRSVVCYVVLLYFQKNNKAKMKVLSLVSKKHLVNFVQ